ncbi:hypothetical protein [Paraburkholderia saeva]|uniref:Uncharacterized protein n=1 Tax=Paraburkholderia saeva TaxID=2777537 RepID=A0A9N8RXV9_9BURK|nr:hypothetical protein [Paraburkholderia saeva]CAG4900956.1 hypothetical protein LMG31841_02937 [Paraburkholderia saeva]
MAARIKVKTDVDPLANFRSVDRGGLAIFLNRSIPATYRIQKTEGFPQPFYVNGEPRWLVTELAQWVQSLADARPAARRKAAKLKVEPATT